MKCQVTTIRKNHKLNDPSLIATIGVRLDFGNSEWIESEVKVLARDKGPHGRGTPYIASRVKFPYEMFKQIRDTVLKLLTEQEELNRQARNCIESPVHQGEGSDERE